jgi:hypothetical protein
VLSFTTGTLMSFCFPALVGDSKALLKRTVPKTTLNTTNNRCLAGNLFVKLMAGPPFA